LGATSDLAYKKIFPALQAMLKRGHLNVTVTGCQIGPEPRPLRMRAQDGLEKQGGPERPIFPPMVNDDIPSKSAAKHM
jgi:glucose-6-phosphate 1-dehydrogenase